MECSFGGGRGCVLRCSHVKCHQPRWWKCLSQLPELEMGKFGVVCFYFFKKIHISDSMIPRSSIPFSMRPTLTSLIKTHPPALPSVLLPSCSFYSTVFCSLNYCSGLSSDSTIKCSSTRRDFTAVAPASEMMPLIYSQAFNYLWLMAEYSKLSGKIHS